MRINYNGLMMEQLSKFASKEEIKKLLANMTDNDFNGENGEEYYTSVEINGEIKEMSRLDFWMSQYDNYDNGLVNFIYDVLKACYSDSYYYDYDTEIMEIEDVLVIACSSAYYC